MKILLSLKRLYAKTMLSILRWLISSGFTRGNQRGYLDLIITLREMAE